MEPRIITIAEKKLIGMSLRMSHSNNRTYELWSGFMPRRKEITGSLNADLISMQVFDESLDFRDFNMNTEFVKWAAVEVHDFNDIPDGMNAYNLKGGLYAVFDYKGPAGSPQPFQFIFGVWMPNSGFTPDKREHFEVLGEKYSNNDPNSEEEIWIPVWAR